MDYEDLVIQLGAGEAGGYTVRVARSPAGETEPEPLVVPVSEDEIDHLATAFGRAARDLKASAASEISALSLAALGDRLFRSLLPEAVRNRYYDNLGRIAAREDSGLRLRVQMGLGIPAMARLHAVPWEYLHSTETGYFLALSRKTSIVRYLDLEMPGDRPPAQPPLAILAVAGEDPALDLARERRAIEEAWRGQGRVQLTLLRNATLDSLREELLARDHHVLHFMGHGGFDPAAGEGSLALRDEEGSRVWAAGPDLAEQVRDISSLRLVVLNACWTARANSSGPYAGVATAMLKAGIPAVLAMQFPISDAAALAFSRTFYRRLARGDTIDAAVTEGRLAIRHGNRVSLEWGTPVLFERLTGGRVVDPPRPKRQSRSLAWRRPAAAALTLALLGSLLLVRTAITRRQPAPASQPARSQSAPTEPARQQVATSASPRGVPASSVPARPPGARSTAPGSPGISASPPAALADVTRKQRPLRPTGSRLYKLTAGEPLFVEELATWVSAEFSQEGREPYLALHLKPPRSPTLNRLVLGATTLDVDLQPGTGHLVILAIDWSEQSVKLSAEPDGPPLGATAQCSDGAYSFSSSHGGTCSHHGGVARWL